MAEEAFNPNGPQKTKWIEMSDQAGAESLGFSK